MNAAALLSDLTDQGLTLALAGERLTVSPASSLTDVTRALIRDHKAELIALLTAANEPAAPPLHPSNRQQAETYLQHIGETDPAAVASFLDGLARHPDRLQWLYRECLRLEIATPVVRAADLEQQAGELVRRFLAEDERRACRQCRNLASNGRCMAASRGELPLTSTRYEPFTERLERCVGYLPDADDADQRPGRERWPSLAKRLWQEQSQ